MKFIVSILKEEIALNTVKGVGKSKILVYKNQHWLLFESL